MEDKEVLERLGFKYNKEKKYFHKAIIPSGDPRGKRYILYFRDGEFWTAPKMGRDHVEFLGEVMLYNAHKEGKIDISSVDLNNPIPIIIEGRQYYAELSLTPEEAEKQLAGRKFEKEQEEKKAIKEKIEQKGVDHFAIIQKLTGYDIFEIFSDSGTGKSKIAIEIARNSIKHNHKVFYYDTEGNITEEEAKVFGNNYRYDPTINGLINFRFPDVDLLIIDSVTYPFWIQFASMNLKQRGEALLNLHAFLGKLKEWCVKNKKVAIIVSQATSELGAEREEERQPWGGKAFHIAKEIVKPELVYSEPNETLVKIVAYRMRRYGRGYEIADVLINNDGVNIKWKIK